MAGKEGGVIVKEKGNLSASSRLGGCFDGLMTPSRGCCDASKPGAN